MTKYFCDVCEDTGIVEFGYFNNWDGTVRWATWAKCPKCGDKNEG